MKSRTSKFVRVSSAVFTLAAASLLLAACGGGSPKDECASDADCPDTTVCEPSIGGGPNVCVEGCHASSQCGAGESCELVVCVTTPCPGHCVSSGCETDADCAAGNVCEPSGPSCGPLECVPGCHTKAQCAAGQTCQTVQCFTCPCPGHCE